MRNILGDLKLLNRYLDVIKYFFILIIIYMARNRKNKTRSRKMRGGSYTSASSYGTYVNGTPESQYNRVFDQQGSYGQIPGNLIIGAQGQNVMPTTRMPTSAEMSLIQKAGRRRHKRGGFLGEVINQAIVPFSLLGMQQTYRRKRGGKKHTRKHRR